MAYSSGEEEMASLVDPQLVDGDEDASEESEGDEKEQDPFMPLPLKAALGCLGGCCLLNLIILLVLIYVGAGLVMKGKNLDSWHNQSVNPHEFPRYMGCGGCNVGIKSNDEIELCSMPCFGLSFVLEWEKLAKRLPYAQVFFPSRKGPRGELPVNISAWWLPGDTSKLPKGVTPPRIVALHGLGSNCNHCGVQASCFHLRTLGFSCLTPTVRDYGLSGPSTHPNIMSWGYDYPYDLLGAWDYAVNDPDGVLGGPLPPNQVGIMGFSKGGLGAAIAVNLEPKIQGAWIDSAPYEGLKGMITALVRPYAGLLTPLIAGPVYWSANSYAGLPVDMYDPVKMFGNCSGPRRDIAVAHGLFDNKVPIGEAAEAVFEIGSRIDCWSLWLFTPGTQCDGASHHQEMWQYPDETRNRFCRFWSDAFNRSDTLCHLETLPKMDLHHNVEQLRQQM